MPGKGNRNVCPLMLFDAFHGCFYSTASSPVSATATSLPNQLQTAKKARNFSRPTCHWQRQRRRRRQRTVTDPTTTISNSVSTRIFLYGYSINSNLCDNDRVLLLLLLLWVFYGNETLRTNRIDKRTCVECSSLRDVMMMMMGGRGDNQLR